MNDNLRIYKNLETFLAEKLESSTEEETHNLKELWKAKRMLIDHALINYSRVLGALTGQGEGKKFRERLGSLLLPDTNSPNQTFPPDFRPDLEENSCFNENKIIEIIDLFLSPNYIPPTDFHDLQDHLVALWIYYTFGEFMSVPLSVAMRIDFAMVKVVSKVERFHWRIAEYGMDSDKKVDRISKIIQRKKIIKDNNKQRVLELYYRLDTSKMTKNKIATSIWGIIEKESTGKPPGINTIKRYLTEEKCPPFA